MTLHNQKGFTLVESLIAIAIFSIGFLAVAAMQTGALSSVTQSRKMTEAVEAMSSMAEELQMLELYPDFDFVNATVGQDFFDVKDDVADDLVEKDWSNPHDRLITDYAVDYLVEWTVTNIETDSNNNDMTVDSDFADNDEPVPVLKVIVLRVAEASNPNRIMGQTEIIKAIEQDITH